MGVSSADPQRLQEFVTGVSAARVSATSEQSSVAGLSTSVTAASPDYHIDVPALGALATVLEQMGVNETFVATVRTELLAADVNATGVVTVDDARIATALAGNGVGAPFTAVVFDPASMVGLPPTSGFVDDPICAANGNMVHQDTDVVFPAIAGALDIVRTWNSLVHARAGVFGPGWDSVLDMRLVVAPSVVRACLAEGAEVTFESSDGAWSATSRRRLRLEPIANGWVLRTDHVRAFEFDSTGRLTGWRVGVAAVTITRADDGRIIGLHEEVTGRSLGVAWVDGLVESVATDDGRTVTYHRDRGGVLSRAVSSAGSLDYVWDGLLLTSVVDADGVPAFTNRYDDAGRVIEQTSPFGRVTTYRYEPTGSTIITDADGVHQAMVHDRAGNLVAVVDSDGSAMRLAYDDHQRVVGVVERDGAEWRYEYDDRDDLVRRVDPDGLAQHWVWDDRHRLIGETDRAGATVRMEFDTLHEAPNRVVGPDGSVASQTLGDRGLPLEIIDADGVVTHLEWDTDGQLLHTRDALGGRIDLAYDDHGLLVRLTPAAAEATVLHRDDAGRVVRRQRGTQTATYTYTAAGRITAGSEPGDIGWSATFGGHGAIASLSDATGATVRFEHDPIGNVSSVVAPDGAAYTNSYDEVGRLVATIEPTGATTRRDYDRRGRLVRFADAVGNAWRRELDGLGRTTTSTAPDGAVTRWTYHPGGEIATVTGPDGRRWHTEIDHAGRPIAVVDPAGGRAEIAYTAAGRVRRRTSPAGRTETFAYDAAGRLTSVVGIDGVRRDLARNLRGFVVAVDDPQRRIGYEWDDDYRLIGVSTDDGTSTVERDDAGRVLGTSDPTGVTSRFTRDARGLLASATDPAGLTTTYEHDTRGRLTGLVAPGQRQTSVEYGPDGRPAATVDPAGSITRLGRDANGAVTALRRHDGTGWDLQLDGLGRETRQTGTDGVVYASVDRDVAGRPTRAAVPGTDIATAFLWDETSRLVAVTTADGTTLIERDADGWVVATTNVDGVRTEYDRDAAGAIVAVRSGDDPAVAVPRPQAVERDRAGRLTIGPDGTVHRYDDAGRITEITPSAGVPTRFDYGPDGLVETETGPHGARRFDYDRAGRVTSVTVDGLGTTTLSYDAAGRREHEQRPDGTRITYRWDPLDRLVAIEREHVLPDGTADQADRGRIDVVYDAASRPIVVGTTAIRYDPVSGRPERVGDRPLLSVGHATYDTVARTWTLDGSDRPAGGVPVGDVVVLGARVLDTVTHQFLSPDPLLAVAGSNGAASAYTYAWHDPVNHVDPTGLRPISIEEYDALRTREEQGRVGQAWQAIKEDPWGTLAAVGVVALGVGLMFTPFAVVGAGILIGAGASAGFGFATGTFSPTAIAVSGVAGGIPGGAALAAGRAGVQLGLGATVAIGATSGGGADLATQALTSDGPINWGSVVFSTFVGGGTGALTHALTPRPSTAVADHAPAPAAAPAPTAATSRQVVATESELSAFGNTTTATTSTGRHGGRAGWAVGPPEPTVARWRIDVRGSSPSTTERSLPHHSRGHGAAAGARCSPRRCRRGRCAASDPRNDLSHAADDVGRLHRPLPRPAMGVRRQEVTRRQPWEDVAAAEVVYLDARRRMFDAGAEEQLSLALQSPTGRGVALRVLRDSPAELLMSLLPDLFSAAVSTHAQVGLARDVLGRLDSGWLSTALEPLVETSLASESVDWSDYRRLAECLSQLGQRRLLEAVVNQAAQSADEDVREVAEDFRRN